MITFPVMRAGAILPHASWMGKFHGTIPATTPNGVYRVMTVRVGESSVISSGILRRGIWVR
jgi:hypothetical protein